MVSYSLPATPTFHRSSPISSTSLTWRLLSPAPIPVKYRPHAFACCLSSPAWRTGELVRPNHEVVLYKDTHNFVLPNCFCVLFTGVPKPCELYTGLSGPNYKQAVLSCAKGDYKCPYWINLDELISKHPDLPRQEYAAVTGYLTPEHPLTQISQTRTFSSIKEEDDFGILPTFGSQDTAKAFSPVKGTALKAPDFGIAPSRSPANHGALEVPVFGDAKPLASPQKFAMHPLFNDDRFMPVSDLKARFYSPPPCEENGLAVEDVSLLSQADTARMIFNLFTAGCSGVTYRELCLLLGKCYRCSQIMTRDRLQEHQCPCDTPDLFSPIVASSSKVDPPQTPGTPVPILRTGEKTKKKKIFLKAAKPPVAGSSKRAPQVVIGEPTAVLTRFGTCVVPKSYGCVNTAPSPSLERRCC